MTADRFLAEIVRLTSAVEALAALSAHARIETEGIDADPLLRSLLAAVAAEVLSDDTELSPAEVAPGIGMAQAFLRSGVDLVANPGSSGAWQVTDPQLLQGLGRLSGAIAGAMATAADELEGLNTRLSSPGAAILDVGTGTGWLSIALARSFPEAHVVGLDIFETSLALARQNVTAEHLEHQVELRLQDVTELIDEASFDAIFLPLPFLPREIVAPAVTATARALKPGGWLLPGTFAGPGDQLSQLLLDVRTVRSGGHPWTPQQIVDHLTDAGLLHGQEVPQRWAAPVRLYAGRRR